MVQSGQPIKDDHLLTVITVVFNARLSMELTLQSIIRQTWQSFEYVVVDGGSSDGTTELLRNSPRIDRLISEPDKGIYDAMNKGVRNAKGRWVIFMNAGDQFLKPDTLLDVSQYLRAENNTRILYGDAEVKLQMNKLVMQYQRDRHLKFERSVIHQSMFILRQHLIDHPYDIKYKIMADYDNLLAISVKSADQIYYVPQCICVYDKSGVSSRPLYTYFREYYLIAFRRMPWLKFISFNLYILPRLVWSLRHLVLR